MVWSAAMTVGLVSFASAFAIAVVLTPVFRHLGRRLGWMDQPNARSSHVVPTPRNGGKAIMLSLLAAAFAGRILADRTLAAVVGLSVLISIVGLIDDARNLPARIKLAVQIALAVVLLAVPEMRMPPLYAAAALIWLVGVTNAFNFMDGVNGIASVEAIVCGLAMAVLLQRAGDPAGAALCLALAGAAAGFFPWNAFTGSIFMGDVGSLPLGFIFAAMTVRGAQRGIEPWMMAAPLLPFLLDTGITLLRRIARREKIFEAHRTHFYQQLTDLGWSHLGVAFAWGALAALAAMVAVAAPRLGRWADPAWALALCVHLAVFAAIAYRKKRRAPAG
jgi:UDP-N-acetylmuramyl pentapeptide phosphotransferase/UDP-N-acetylglucosamine-1-phosphate transferase